MSMAEAVSERVTVYLTPQNRQRLASLKRGEKMKKLNEALDFAFEKEERRKAFDGFMESLKAVDPATPIMPSDEIVRMLREGRDGDLADLKS